MEVVIVDQEAGSRSRIARHFEALPGWDVVGQYQFDRKAVAGIRRARPPVVVIGLSPDHTSSLGWIRSLADTRIPPAILIVGYGNAQALTAFEVGATGYLCRPVTRNALINALADLQRITLPLRGL